MPIHFNTKHIDRPFWTLFIALVITAILALFSAGSTLAYNAEGGMFSPFIKQVIYLFLGVAVAFGVQMIPSNYIRLGGYLILAISLFCLYLMLIPNSPFVKNINGAGRWFNLFGFQFQPSELAKVGLIVSVADLLSRIRSGEEGKEDAKRYFYITLGLTIFTCFPIMTGNLSTALLLAGIVLLLWILVRIPSKYILTTLGIAVATMVIGYCIVEFGYLRPQKKMNSKLFGRAITWVGRIDDMLAEQQEDESTFRLTDDNYQRSLAKVAVARGGKTLFGVLPGNSKERDYLPLAYADYIFAIIVEETGIIGAICLIVLYLLILFRACWVSSRYEDYSAMLMVMGLALMIVCQAFVSMAVAVGLGPVTGQPLPMISKGGTSVIITSLYFGIIMAVAREQNERKARVEASVRESYLDAPESV